MSLLTTTRLTKRFGGILAVNELELGVEPGQICALIGPNGSGKTTVLNVITGIYQPSGGTVNFQGQAIHGRPPPRGLRPRHRADLSEYSSAPFPVGL